MTAIDDLRAALGATLPARTDVVERRHLEDYLRAVDEDAPGDPEQVPPSFVACFLHEPPPLPVAEAYGQGWLNGGDAFELLAPLRVGDTLHSTSVLVDAVEKDGSGGAMAMLTFRTDFTLGDGTVAVRHTGTRIRR